MPTTQQTAQETPPDASQAALIGVIVAILVQYLGYQKAKETLLAAGITVQALATALGTLYLLTGAAVRSAIREMARIEFTDALNVRGSADELVDAMVNLEAQLEDMFVANSTRRIALSIRKAVEREEDVRDALERALRRERRYSSMRMIAARRRLQLRIEEANIKAISPEGAYWLLDVTKATHTADCLAMAGKAWSWKVLGVISPSNRHYQCGCTLLPMGTARADGLPNSDRIRKRIPRAALRDD